MTLTQLLSKTRLYINEKDSTNSHVTDADITSFLNEAYRDLNGTLGFIRNEATGTSVENTATYALSGVFSVTNFLYALEFFFDANGEGETKLEAVTPIDLARLYGNAWRDDGSSVPKVYYFSDELTIGVHPKPNANNASQTMRLCYVQNPTELSAGGDEPVMPDLYQDIMTMFAASKCFDIIKSPELALKMMGQYEVKKKELRLMVGKKSQEFLAWRW